MPLKQEARIYSVNIRAFKPLTESRSFWLIWKRQSVELRNLRTRCAEVGLVVFEIVSIFAAVVVFVAFVIHEIVNFINFLFF
jgi:hypothetical protein